MAKTKLNNTHRSLLKQLAKRLVCWSEGQLKEKDKLEKLITKKFKELFQKNYPQKDLDVLKKYSLVIPVTSVRYRTSKNNYESTKSFHLSEELYCPRNSEPVNHPGIYPEEELLELLSKHNSFCSAVNYDINQRLNNYYILIEDTKYYEDVVSIWPEAIEEKSRIVTDCVALSRISSVVIDNIKADLKTRKVFANVE